jgi:hypothetical protein
MGSRLTALRVLRVAWVGKHASLLGNRARYTVARRGERQHGTTTSFLVIAPHMNIMNIEFGQSWVSLIALLVQKLAVLYNGIWPRS